MRPCTRSGSRSPSAPRLREAWVQRTHLYGIPVAQQARHSHPYQLPAAIPQSRCTGRAGHHRWRRRR